MAKLTKEERALLQSYEKGEWQSIPREKSEARRYEAYARITLQKDRRINIRLSTRDLEGIQRKAIEEGIPYQTLVSSIIHKYVSGRLKERHA